MLIIGIAMISIDVVMVIDSVVLREIYTSVTNAALAEGSTNMCTR